MAEKRILKMPEYYKMKIIHSLQVHAPGKNTNKINAFPALVKLQNNDILIAFQSASSKNAADATTNFRRSSDLGRSWSEPFAPFQKWAEEKIYSIHVCYITQLKSGELLASIMLCDRNNAQDKLFFNPKTGGALPMYIGLSRSLDNGYTWSSPEIIPTGKFDDKPVPIMSPILELDNGDLFLPFEVSKPYEDPTPWIHYAAALISQNGGKTWEECIVTAHDPENSKYFWDNKIIQLHNGVMLGIFWTFDTKNNKDLCIHVSTSSDQGHTWSIPEATDISGQVTFPLALDNGTIVAVSVDRFAEHAIKLYTAKDDLRKWTPQGVVYCHIITEKANNDLNENLTEMQYWSFGLPAMLSLPDDELLIVWYAGSSEYTAIESSIVKLQE